MFSRISPPCRKTLNLGGQAPVGTGTGRYNTHRYNTHRYTQYEFGRLRSDKGAKRGVFLFPTTGVRPGWVLPQSYNPVEGVHQG